MHTPQDKTADDFYWYHSIDLLNGQKTRGDYDMEKYLPYYHFPSDMTGMSVLDVGRASGFFSFEFERRGADVTATELRSMADWDFLGGEDVRKERLKAYSSGKENIDDHMIRGAFFFAHNLRKSKVKPVDASIYELSPSLFGNKKFDLVFAWSLTSHLKNPIMAFERLLSVTAGTCIISAPSLEIQEFSTIPLMAFVGKQSDVDQRSWWVYTPMALEEALYAAGFTKVEIVSNFIIKNDNIIVPHIVAHATVNKIMKGEEYFDLSSKSHSHNFIYSGFYEAEDWGRWTNGHTSSIRFLETLPDSFDLQLDVCHLIRDNIDKKFKIKVNSIEHDLVMSSPGVYTLRFNNVSESKEIFVYTPVVYKPDQLDSNKDTRHIGLGLKGLRIIPHD